MLSNVAMNTIGANDRVCCSCSSVFEVNYYGTILLVIQMNNTFVEVCALRWDAFDKLV